MEEEAAAAVFRRNQAPRAKEAATRQPRKTERAAVVLPAVVP
jgi:hypothetical protein